MNNDRILINKLKSFENINTNLLNIILALFGTLLLAISSKVQVPFWPVPMTMQTFVIFLIGMTYGVRLSFATVALYLLKVQLDLPVFASGGGFSYLLGPTAGFLYGMLICFSSHKLFCKFEDLAKHILRQQFLLLWDP